MKCYWAEQHVSIDSEGTFRPCCTWRSQDNEPPVTSIEDYFNSDFYKNLNDQLANNVWPTGCEDCKEHEILKKSSMRVERSVCYDFDYKYTDAEVKFGNLCNLGCVMCSPYNSSLIQDEYLKMKGQHELFERVTNIKTSWFKDEDHLKSIAKSLSDRTEIQFSGGEPTVNNYLRIFLEELLKNNSNARILIRTNGNNWPKKLHDILSQFKTKISISIDAVGKKNEYIRWPSNWDKTQKNIDKINTLPNTSIKINPTVACYNVHLLPELYEWALQNNITNFNFDSVWTPEILAANNSEKWQKEIYAEAAKKYIPLRKTLNHVLKEGNGLTEAIDFLKILDYNRGTNYKILGI